jgi:hypothetical protein
MLLAFSVGEGVIELGVEERAEAERLRQALEGGAGHPLAELAGALRAADISDHRDIHAVDHEAIVALSLGVDAQLEEHERDEAARTREALRRRDAHPLAELAGALRAATASSHLAEADQRTLLALALGEELVASDEARELAEAIEQRSAPTPLAELAMSLRAAHSSASSRGGTLHDLAHERVLRRAIPRGRSTPVIVGALVAMAAGIALFFGSWSWLETGPVGGRDVPIAQAGMVAALIPSRSTQELFDPTEPFPAKGGESDRIDRMVTARSSDLRQNRFSAWGVQ